MSATKVNSSFETSVLLGQVVDNLDPKQNGRVQVFIPQLHTSKQENSLPWAMPISPMFGGGKSTKNSPGTDNWGFYMTPQIDEWVVLIPLLGDMATLLCIGSLRSTFQKLPDTPNASGTNSPSTYEMRFPNGNRLVIKTAAGDSSIRLETTKNYSIDINDTADNITIQCNNATITMTAAGDISITGSSSITATSSGPVTVSGSTINLN